MGIDTAMALAALGLVLLIPLHQQLTIRALRYALARQREQLHQHHRAIVQLQSAAVVPPTSVGQPMPTVAEFRSKFYDVGIRSQPRLHSDPTLRLKRPPAMSDVAAAIVRAGRPLTRANLTTELERDVRTEIRAAMLAGTLQMVRTHDDEPAYWPTGHPRPGDTVRLSRMPVLPGVTP